MDSTNINAVLQQRIALRKKQKEEKLQQEKQENINKQQQINAKEYILSESEQKQLSEDVTKELELIKIEDNWKLNPTTDFANLSTLRRKLITYFHYILLTELPDLATKKINIDETKKLQESNYVTENSIPDPVMVYEKSLSFSTEIKKDILPLLVKLQDDTLDSQIMVSLAIVILELQRGEQRDCLQSYLDLSIGKVIWPIGVQNIGIHFKITGKEDERDKANFLKEGDWIIALKSIINMKFLK